MFQEKRPRPESDDDVNTFLDDSVSHKNGRKGSVIPTRSKDTTPDSGAVSNFYFYDFS